MNCVTYYNVSHMVSRKRQRRSQVYKDVLILSDHEDLTDCSRVDPIYELFAISSNCLD